MPEEKKEDQKNKKCGCFCKKIKLIDVVLILFFIGVLSVSLIFVVCKEGESEQVSTHPVIKTEIVNEFMNTFQKAESVDYSDNDRELIISSDGKSEVAYRVDEKTEIYATPELSPDGHKIVTVLDPVDRVNYNDEDYGVAIFDLETKEKKMIAEGAGFGMSIKWSPDGKYIAYDVEGALNIDDYGIWLYNINTNINTQLVSDYSNSVSVNSWSLDGDSVSYWAGYGHGDGEYFSINILTKEIKKIEESESEWKNTEHIIQTERVNEFTNTLTKAESVDYSDDDRELIISDGVKSEVAYRVDEKTEIYATPELSPDGHKIATVLDPVDRVNYNDEDYGVAIFDLETKEKKMIAEGAGFGMSIKWSPDGKYIAYENEGAKPSGDLYLFNNLTFKSEMLVDSEDSLKLRSWSIDGKELSYWASYGHGDGEYFSINILTKEIKKTEESELDDATKWQQSK